MSRALRTLLLTVVAALALGGCTGDGTTDPPTPSVPPDAVVGLTFIPNIQFAPFYIAASDRYLPEYVTLRHHGSAEGLFTALTAGEEQFVVAGGDEILQARGQGTDIVAIAAYYRRYPARIIVPADSDIQSLADLKGHTIGVPGRYGESWFALVLALQEAGLTEADVTIQSIGYTLQAALTTNQVDAAIGFANGDAVTLAASGFAIRTIDPAVPLVSICLAATRAYAEAHPETVRATVTALRQGIESVIADPAHALDVADRYIPNFSDPDARATAELVLAATSELFTDAGGHIAGDLDQAEWEAMAQAMGQAGLIASTNAEDAMTNDYA
jgi:NitT/TauT family transport system substrate-binding protein